MKEQQKKKAAPVLVVLILIVIVGAAGVVSFLINRYKPGTEYMAGNEYFNLTDENSVALIQNGELLEEQAVLIGGEPYAAYTYVESQLNSCFYWDEETKGILLTTSGGVQTLLPGDAAVAKTPGGQPAVQQESDGRKTKKSLQHPRKRMWIWYAPSTSQPSTMSSAPQKR